MGLLGARALKPVAVSEQKNTASVEDYVLAHANVQYVGNGDELSRKDVLTVTTTVVDGSKLPDATLDKLWRTQMVMACPTITRPCFLRRSPMPYSSRLTRMPTIMLVGPVPTSRVLS